MSVFLRACEARDALVEQAVLSHSANVALYTKTSQQSGEHLDWRYDGSKKDVVKTRWAAIAIVGSTRVAVR